MYSLPRHVVENNGWIFSKPGTDAKHSVEMIVP